MNNFRYELDIGNEVIYFKDLDEGNLFVTCYKNGSDQYGVFVKLHKGTINEPCYFGQNIIDTNPEYDFWPHPETEQMVRRIKIIGIPNREGIF